MKEATLKTCSWVIKAAAMATALTSVCGILPTKAGIIAALVFMGISTLKDFATKAGDLLDDGIENGSFKA